MLVCSPKVFSLQALAHKSTLQISKKWVCVRFCCNFPILVKQQNCSQYFPVTSYFLHFNFIGEIFCFPSIATPKKKKKKKVFLFEMILKDKQRFKKVIFYRYIQLSLSRGTKKVLLKVLPSK